MRNLIQTTRDKAHSQPHRHVLSGPTRHAQTDDSLHYYACGGFIFPNHPQDSLGWSQNPCSQRNGQPSGSNHLLHTKWLWKHPKRFVDEHYECAKANLMCYERSSIRHFTSMCPKRLARKARSLNLPSRSSPTVSPVHSNQRGRKNGQRSRKATEGGNDTRSHNPVKPQNLLKRMWSQYNWSKACPHFWCTKRG
jgi:hypothetical protein